MDGSQDDIFARLNAAIEDWNTQLADSHNRLTEKIASAREHLRGMLDSEEATAEVTPSADTAVALTAALEEASSLRGALTDAEARIEALEAELRAARATLDADSDAAAQIAAFEAESTASQGMALCEAERADTAEEALAEVREKLGAAEAALTEEREARIEIAKSLDASKARVRNLLEEQKEISALRGEVESLRAQLAAKDDALALDALENSLRESKALAEKIQAENVKLKAECDQMREERNRALQVAEGAKTIAAVSGVKSTERVSKWMSKQASSGNPKLVDDPFAEPVPEDLAGDAIVAFDERGRKRRMGDILVDAGLITREQLDKVIEIQKMRPQQRFGALVVRMGFADEDAIAHVLAAQLGMPYIDLRSIEIDGHAVTVIPGKMARAHMCVPIQRKMGMVLKVAFANPLDIVGIENIERATGSRVEPVVATHSAIEAVLVRYFPNLR